MMVVAKLSEYKYDSKTSTNPVNVYEYDKGGQSIEYFADFDIGEYANDSSDAGTGEPWLCGEGVVRVIQEGGGPVRTSLCHMDLHQVRACQNIQAYLWLTVLNLFNHGFQMPPPPNRPCLIDKMTEVCLFGLGSQHGNHIEIGIKFFGYFLNIIYCSGHWLYKDGTKGLVFQSCVLLLNQNTRKHI